MIETFTATEEAEPPGWYVPRRSLGTRVDYVEAMSEASTAIEEAEPLGQCFPRGSLGKSNRVE
jgi:hypothetical protein